MLFIFSVVVGGGGVGGDSFLKEIFRIFLFRYGKSYHKMTDDPKLTILLYWTLYFFTLFPESPIDQRESEVGVNFRGNFRCQLLLVNSMVLDTTLCGDRAGDDAFSLDPPKPAKKPPNLHLKNHWSYEPVVETFFCGDSLHSAECFSSAGGAL